MFVVVREARAGVGRGGGGKIRQAQSMPILPCHISCLPARSMGAFRSVNKPDVNYAGALHARKPVNSVNADAMVAAAMEKILAKPGCLKRTAGSKISSVRKASYQLFYTLCKR